MSRDCDHCNMPITSEPWVSTHKGAYQFTCTNACKSSLEAQNARELTNQRSLALGHRAWNGAD